jgi:hypothetical protein
MTKLYEFPNLIHLAAQSSNSFLASKQINHIFMTRNNKKFDIILLHSPTASFTIPTSPTRAASTPPGECTSGSTGCRMGGTKRPSWLRRHDEYIRDYR